MRISDTIPEPDSVLLTCDLMAIPSEDRKRYRELRLHLSDSLISRSEVQGGYVFEFCSEHLSRDELSEWIDLEHMCCPWISIVLGTILAQTIDVHMTFPDRAKEIVRAEFSDWLES
jgi:hypothetical protein